MYNRDPAEEIPDDTGPITVPVGTPNQFGGAFVGRPSDPDPTGTAQVAATLRDAQNAGQQQWLATHNPNTGAPKPPPAPANDVTAVVPTAPVASSVAPQADRNAPAAAPDAAPTTPTPAETAAAPPPPPPKPVHHASHAAGGGSAPGNDGLPAGSADLQEQIKEGNKAEGAAITAEGEAKQQAGQDLGQAYADKQDLIRQQSADLAAEQQYVHDQNQRLDAEDAENLKAAKEKTIPDFWAGREGALAGSAITVALSGAAGALLGSTHNQALDAINKNIDGYYSREKEKIDNLYKYAEQKGQLDEKMRHQYASELTDLMQQHAYTLQSAADRIQQVQAESQGQVDKAGSDRLAAQLQSKGAAELQSARGFDLQIDDAKNKRIEAKAALIRANADAMKARAEANKIKGDAAVEKEIKPISTEFDKDEQRLKGSTKSPGLVMKQQDIRELGNNLRQAIASGDPQAATAAAIQAKEKISRLNTGAAPSGHVLEFLDSLQGDPQKAVSTMQKVMGNPKTSSQMLGGLIKIIDQSDEGALRQIDKERQNVVAKYIGPSGIARTAAQRQHVMGRLNGVFNQTTTRTAQGEVPRYQEGGATPGQGAEPAQADPNAEAKAWVAAHPTDPRAAQIRQRLGM